MSYEICDLLEDRSKLLSLEYEDNNLIDFGNPSVSSASNIVLVLKVARLLFKNLDAIIRFSDCFRSRSCQFSSLMSSVSII